MVHTQFSDRETPPRDTTERQLWRDTILAPAFQGGVTSDYWLGALLNRVESRR